MARDISNTAPAFNDSPLDNNETLRRYSHGQGSLAGALIKDFRRMLKLESARERGGKREISISRAINISVKDVGGRADPLRRAEGFIAATAGRKDSPLF